MQHSFDVGEATKYGVEEATVIHSLRYWQSHNAMNHLHFHHGRTWVRMPINRMLKFFPYFKYERKLSRVLESLEKQGAVLSTKEFNRIRTNHTKFYSLADSIMMPVVDLGPMPDDEEWNATQLEEPEVAKPFGHVPPADQTPTFQFASPSPQLTNLSARSDSYVKSDVTYLSNPSTDESVKSHASNVSNPAIGQSTQMANGFDETVNSIGNTIIEITNRVEGSGGGGRNAYAQEATPTPPVLNSEIHYLPGEVPAFVQRDREAIRPAMHPAEETPEEEKGWCTVSGLPCTREQLVKLINLLHAGDKANVFHKHFGRPYTDYIEAFIEQRAMSETFSNRTNVNSIFQMFCRDVSTGRRTLNGPVIKPGGGSRDPERKNPQPITEQDRQHAMNRFKLPANGPTNPNQ